LEEAENPKPTSADTAIARGFGRAIYLGVNKRRAGWSASRRSAELAAILLAKLRLKRMGKLAQRAGGTVP